MLWSPPRSFLEWVGGAPAVLDRDPALPGERFDAGRAAELAVAGVLHAAEGGHGFISVLGLPQIAASASDLVTVRPKAPYSCRSPNISMRMDWSRPPTLTGSNPSARISSATRSPAAASSAA